MNGGPVSATSQRTSLVSRVDQIYEHCCTIENRLVGILHTLVPPEPAQGTIGVKHDRSPAALDRADEITRVLDCIDDLLFRLRQAIGGQE